MSKKSAKSFKKGSRTTDLNANRVLYEKEEMEENGIVLKKLGGGNFLVNLVSENKEIVARLCGKFRKGNQKKNNWVTEGKVVVVGLRDFQDKKCDITYIYTDAEIKELKKKNIITESHLISENQVNDDVGFDFNDI